MRRKTNLSSSAMGLSRGASLGVRPGNRKKMASNALSIGKSEAVRPGLNSKNMALGRSMGRRKGPSPAVALSKGATLGVRRFAEGGHLGMEDDNCTKRFKLSNERDEKLEVPHYKKGGKVVKELWIQAAIKPSKKGALHKSLGVPLGRKIPESKLERAEHSRSPILRKRARLAETLRTFHHRGQR